MRSFRSKLRSKVGLLRGPRGQAMLEYSLVSHMLLIGGGGLMFAVFGSQNGLLASINKFYDSVYFVLESAAL